MKKLKKDYLYPVELKMARVLARVKFAVKEPIVQSILHQNKLFRDLIAIHRICLQRH